MWTVIASRLDGVSAAAAHWAQDKGQLVKLLWWEDLSQSDQQQWEATLGQQLRGFSSLPAFPQGVLNPLPVLVGQQLAAVGWQRQEWDTLINKT